MQEYKVLPIFSATALSIKFGLLLSWLETEGRLVAS